MVQLRYNDVQLLRAVAEARFVSTTLAAEFFFAHRSNAKRRLHQLARAGLLRKCQRAVTDEALWTPTAKALRALHESGPLDGNGTEFRLGNGRVPSRLFLRHELAVNRVQLSFRAAAVEREGVEVVRWRSGSHAAVKVTDRDGTKLPIISDALLTLSCGGSRFHFAVEVDRGSKPLRRYSKGTNLLQQLSAYSLAFEQGWGLAAFGCPGQSPQHCPFRVLTTAPSWTRLVGTAATMVADTRRRHLPASGLRAYALFGHACADPLGAAVWLAECQVFPFLTWLEEQVPVGAPIAGCLHPVNDGDVRQALGDAGTLPFRQRTPSGRIVMDPAVRAAFVHALVATERVELVSVLDPSWA